MIGNAIAMNPKAAGTITTAVSRIPREKSIRTSSTCRSDQAADIAGSSAVKIETAKIAWGSENTMKAAA